jgi:hypothetical protein
MANRKIVIKSSSTWRLKNVFLYSTWVNQEIPREILKHFELKNENATISICRMQ